MEKTTFYFSHDYNTRTDIKIKKLIQRTGMQGYGVYWAIVEDLYNNNNNLPLDYEQFAYDLRTDEELVKSVINDFGLFEVNDESFYSNSVDKRLDLLKSKINNCKAAAKIRWGEDIDGKRKKAKDTIFYVIRIYNEKESFIKAGITQESVSRRFSGKLAKYKYDLLFLNDNKLAKCLELEKMISSKFNSYIPLEKIFGYNECYNIDDKDSIISLAMQHFEIRNADNNFRNADNNFRNAIKESKEKESKENEIKLNDINSNNNTDTITTNDKKEKNTKKEKKHIPMPTESEQQMFDQARKFYLGSKRGLKTEFDNFVKKYPTEWRNILPLLLPAILREKVDKEQKLKNNGFNQQWKNFSTWINGRCWEIEYPNVSEKEVNELGISVTTNESGEQKVEVKQDRSSFPLYSSMKVMPHVYPEGTESRCGYYVIKNKECVRTKKY